MLYLFDITVINIYDNNELMMSLIILIGLTISSNNSNSNINCDDNSWYGIIYNTWYDFIYKFNVICQPDWKNKWSGLYLMKKSKNKKQMKFGLGR